MDGWDPTLDRRHDRAFTLIEVLVVVAIIALLVSILLPSLSRARDQARTAVCAANLRTCGQAAAFYMHENHEYLPPSGEWSERTHVYIQKLSLTRFSGQEATTTGVDVQVPFYICPSDVIRAPTSQVNRRINGKAVTTNYVVSYAMNGYLVWPLLSIADTLAGKDYSLTQRTAGRDPLGNPIYVPLVSSSTWKRRGEVVLMTDAGNDDLGDGGSLKAGEINWDLDDDNDFNGPVLEVHHRVGNNFLYTDQHVGFTRMTSKPPIMPAGTSPPPGSYGVPKFPHHWIPLNFLW